MQATALGNGDVDRTRRLDVAQHGVVFTAGEPLYPRLELHVILDQRGTAFRIDTARLHLANNVAAGLSLGRREPVWALGCVLSHGLYMGCKIFPDKTAISARGSPQSIRRAIVVG